MAEYKIYKSSQKAVRLMLLCSIFVSAGIFILNQPDSSKFMAWLTILFFGLGYPIGIFQLLDKRPQIIINEIGIFDRTAHKNFINWEIIQDVYLTEMYGQKFICLVVNEQFEPSKSKGKLTKKAAEFSKALGFQELNISLDNIKVDAERLASFILAMRTAEKPVREALIRKKLPDIR